MKNLRITTIVAGFVIMSLSGCAGSPTSAPVIMVKPSFLIEGQVNLEVKNKSQQKYNVNGGSALSYEVDTKGVETSIIKSLKGAFTNTSVSIYDIQVSINRIEPRLRNDRGWITTVSNVDIDIDATIEVSKDGGRIKKQTFYASGHGADHESTADIGIAASEAFEEATEKMIIQMQDFIRNY